MKVTKFLFLLSALVPFVSSGKADDVAKQEVPDKFVGECVLELPNNGHIITNWIL
jgi:hypothetical protein